MRACDITASLKALALGCLFLLSPMTAYSVDELGLFELDANAVEEGVAGDDWETLCDSVAVPGGPCQSPPGGSQFAFTGIVPDPAPASIFDGGKKDIQDVSEWSHKDGAVPDKSDITNAYAAAYLSTLNVPPVHSIGDLILYFGADRVINNGDTFMGFWFFKDLVRAEPDGTFSGQHMPGDTLVLVNFPQATNAVPLIQVVEWDPTCPKADNNSPQPGDCAAKNLRLRFGASGAGAICDAANPQEACALTNDVTEDAPWPYESKDGFINQFPFETFFEGGINISEVIGGEACFASFMAETRSSSSFTASLKDFVIADFPVCGTELRTEIHEKGDESTNYDGQSLPTGTFIHDAAFLKVTGAGTITPSGDIIIDQYNSGNCTGTPTEVLNTDVSNGTLVGDELKFETSDVEYTISGNGVAISFLARFVSDDGVLPDATAPCETVTLNTVNSSVVTEIHEKGTHTPNLDGGSIFVGIEVHDFADVTSSGGLDLTGSVKFTLYPSDNCTGTPIAGFGTNGVETVTLAANDTAETSDFDTAGYLTAGGGDMSISFLAEYSGDANHKPSTALCEKVLVQKRLPSIETHVIVLDRAKVEGDGYAINPTGDVDFNIYLTADCAGTASATKTVALKDAGSVSDGDLVATLLAADATVISTLNATSSVSYIATYKGDANYDPVTHACENVDVTLPAKTTATKP